MYRSFSKAVAVVVAWVLCASSVNAGTYYVYYQLKSVNEANRNETWIYAASFATEMDYTDLSTGKKTSAYQDALDFAKELRKDHGDDIADIEIRYKGSPSSSPSPLGDSRALAGMKPGGPNDFKKIGDGVVENARKRAELLDNQLRMKAAKDQLDKEKAGLDNEQAQLIEDGRDLRGQEQQIIWVRDPQTGRRYLADLSEHPRLWQEGQAITAEPGRLQIRLGSVQRNEQSLNQSFPVLAAQKAQLASIERRIDSLPSTTVTGTSGSVALYAEGLGDFSFEVSDNPERTSLQAKYSAAAASVRQFETLLLQQRDQVNLEKNRIRDDLATTSQRLDQWSAQVLQVLGTGPLERKRQGRAARVQKYLDAKKQYDAKAARFESDDWWKAVDQYTRDMEAVNEKLNNLKLSP